MADRPLTMDDITDDEGRFVCDNCDRTFESTTAYGNHLNVHTSGTHWRSDRCPACETCRDLDSRSIEYQLHKLEDHHLPLRQLNGLMPGEFEAAQAKANGPVELANEIGKSIKWVLKARRFYEDRPGRDEPHTPSQTAADPDIPTWEEVGD